MSKIRVYCVDDHPVIVRGLVEDLREFSDIDVVGHSTDSVKALEEILAKASEIDVVVSDIEMPHVSGFEICTAVKAHGGPKVVFFTYHATPEVSFKADHAGADGLLFKHAGPDEIADGIRMAHRGLNVRSKLVEQTDRAEKVAASLTETEEMILRLIVCECLTSTQIAERLFRSKHTVETHRRNMMAKLKAKNVLELVQYAQTVGICAESPKL